MARPAISKRSSGVNMELGPHAVVDFQFPPGGDQASARPQEKERHQRQHVPLPRQPAPLPPKDNQQPAGQRGGHRLAENRQQEQPQGPPIERHSPRLVELEIGQHGPQVEHGREGVLLLRDPGHRFGLDRMQGEDGGRQIGPGNRQPPQDQGHQKGGRRVQQNIHQVIAERGVAPQPVLDPEGTVQHRVILQRGAHVEPDPPQSIPGSQVGQGDVLVVVPKNPALPRGPIDRQHREHQDGP